MISGINKYKIPAKKYNSLFIKLTKLNFKNMNNKLSQIKNKYKKKKIV